MKSKRIREKVGQVFQVPLGNGLFGYGQVATKTKQVFFDYQDDGSAEDLEKIIQRPMLFIICVDSYVIKEGLWKVLGVLPVNPDFEKEEDVFSYDSIKEKYVIWKTGIHKVIATPEEIYNLECFSSWEHGAVADRLRDHFAGRPCYWVDEARNQHNIHFKRDIHEFYEQYGYAHPFGKEMI